MIEDTSANRPRSRKKFLFSAFFGLVLGGLIGSVITYHYASEKADRFEKSLKEAWEMVYVVVVSQDIKSGTTLKYDMMAKAKIPRQYVSENMISPKSVEQVTGQKVKVLLKRGDFIRWGDLGGSTEPIKKPEDKPKNASP